MLDLHGKSVALIGYGVSNRALGEYLTKRGIDFVVRCPTECDLPKGQRAVFGSGYLDACEDVVFRSPGVHPRLIGRRAYTEVGYGLELCRGFKIAVTGSDGKTTTSTLIHRMLLAGGKSAFLGGNIGCPIVELGSGLTEGDFLVTELSSFQLMDMTPHLDIGAVTNVSQNHLDWHENMDEYISAKENIVKNASLGVLNYDDGAVREFGCRCNGQKKIYFSLENLDFLVGTGNSYAYVAQGQVCFDGVRLFPVADICLRGDFNLQNILCAVGCAYPLVGKDACHAVAREFCGARGRQEVVCQKNGVTYVCSAIDTTPTRTKNTLSAFPKNRTVAILGGYDKNLDYTCLKEATRDLKAAVLCGENREKIRGVAMCPIYDAHTLEGAVTLCAKIATAGDFVILTPASASFDMFKNYREKEECFVAAVSSL